MRLITLNLWGGQVFEPLLKFIQTHSINTDIFCFQEVLFGGKAEFTTKHKARINLFSELEKKLSDFTAITYSAPEEAKHFQSELLPKGVQAGQAIFVRKLLKVTDNGGFRAYAGSPIGMDEGGKITSSCQWIESEVAGEKILVVNIHGLWQRDSQKKDTPERLKQSEIINEFLSKRNGKKILCGDFNLLPTGKSIEKLEKNMINLVKQFEVTTTRSELYTKPDKFADYILVSPGITVEEFKVLPDVVSDHLPLLLQFH